MLLVVQGHQTIIQFVLVRISSALSQIVIQDNYDIMCLV